MGKDNLIKECREARGLKQTDLVNEIKKVDERVDVSLLSKFENDVCLPTRRQLKRMCFVLGVSPRRIYKNGTLSLASCLETNVNDSINPVYHFKVDLPDEFRSMININVLKMNGYDSREEWIVDCIKHLQQGQKKSPAHIA